MNNRKVKYYYANDKNKNEAELAGTGIFRSWGVDFMERENGMGNFSTAIIELPNGQLINHPVELVVFVKEVIKRLNS